MRLHILLGITCLSLLFSGCGDSGGTSNSTSDPGGPGAAGIGGGGGTGGTDPINTGPKNLFAVWTEEGNNFNLDFRSAQFGISSEVLITSNTVGSCSCQVLIQGSQASGTMVFSNCTNGAAGCLSLRPSGSFTKTSSSLQICTSLSCFNMK